MRKEILKSEELSLTNLDKIYWPKEGYTKGDLINYYHEISSFILPHLKDRPETLKRFPNGIEGESFFQKNVDHKFPDWVPTALVQHETKDYRYLLIQNVNSLLFAINLGCIDLNPFNSRIDHINNPDYMVIDLDPEEIHFDAVIEAALAFHDIFKKYDVPSFCKTSGATGLHIYLPVEAKYTFDQVKQFALLLAGMVHESLPKTTSLERSPAKRKDKVYLDYLQNNFGQNMAAPYSVRPRPGATVSTPLDWSEVKKGLNPKDFTIENIPERLKKKGDIFKPILHKGINLQKFLKNLQKE